MNAALLKAELAIAVNPAVAFPRGATVRLSWPMARHARGIFADALYASLAEYRMFVLGNPLHLSLNEGSLVQISYDFKDGEMLRHRFCYYPCPLAIPEKEYMTDLEAWDYALEQELYGQIEVLASEDVKLENIPMVKPGLLRLRSPIRFDYDPEKQSDAEPASHVHLGDVRARIPVHAAISLGQFMRFVISNFYPSYSTVLDSISSAQYDRCISMTEESQLHFDCRKQL
jgi:hypothetical protein